MVRLKHPHFFRLPENNRLRHSKGLEAWKLSRHFGYTWLHG